MVPAAVHPSPSLNLQKTPIFVGKSSVVICWLDHWQVNTCSPQHLSIIAYSFVPWQFRTNGGPANHSKIDDFQHGVPNGLMFCLVWGVVDCGFPLGYENGYYMILWYWYGGVSMISTFIFFLIWHPAEWWPYPLMRTPGERLRLKWWRLVLEVSNLRFSPWIFLGWFRWIVRWFLGKFDHDLTSRPNPGNHGLC